MKCGGDFLKIGGLNGWAFTVVVSTSVIKLHIEHSTKKNRENFKVANLHRKNDVFKNTRSKRHSNYYGFKKNRSQTNPLHPEKIMHFFDNLINNVDFWSHFGAHWILKGVPKSTIFGNNLKIIRKMRSKKRVGKHIIS